MHLTPTSPEVLALNGGSPVRKTFLPYSRQSIDDDDIQAVVDVLRSAWLTGGPKVDEFEQAFASQVDAKYAVTFSSGTAALHGAAFAAGLGAGDEAIMSPLTFVATANCVLYQGARPVFADVSPDTLNIDPERVVERITPKTRAILPVAYGGHPADLDAILGLAEQHGLTVVEDACHALGAKYRERRTGSIAHMSVFSFHPVKHITTGEGGMVTTDRSDFAESLRRFRNHGISSEARERQVSGQLRYEMVALGYNYRLTDIACVLGISQLKKLEQNLASRRAIAARYTAAFSGIPGVVAPVVHEDVNPAWHLYPIRLDLGHFRVDRDQIISALRGENIGTTVHYVPVHQHPYYRDQFGYVSGGYPVAEAAYERLISLPMFHAMKDQDVEDVIAAVRKIAHFYGS
jgi:perosamine synthetase